MTRFGNSLAFSDCVLRLFFLSSSSEDSDLDRVADCRHAIFTGYTYDRTTLVKSKSCPLPLSQKSGARKFLSSLLEFEV